MGNGRWLIGKGFGGLARATIEVLMYIIFLADLFSDLTGLNPYPKTVGISFCSVFVPILTRSTVEVSTYTAFGLKYFQVDGTHSLTQDRRNVVCFFVPILTLATVDVSIWLK